MQPPRISYHGADGLAKTHINELNAYVVKHADAFGSCLGCILHWCVDRQRKQCPLCRGTISMIKHHLYCVTASLNVVPQ